MGLIKSALGSAGGVLGDQWKEYFYCDSMPADILATKGKKKVTSKSSNQSTDNIITNGSVISVADGQCMMIVEQGKVVDFCAETGEFTYDASTEPSLFDGGKLTANIVSVFKNMGKRFTFGGEAPKDQRVYYFNTKEIIGNKYGTSNPIPFRVVDARAGIDIDVSVKCFGEYSFKITNPILFYTNVCGNISGSYSREELDTQMKSEFLTALMPAFAKISELGIRYSTLPAHATELADAMNTELSAKWKDLRGIEIISCGVSSITADEEDEKMLKSMQRNAAFTDPKMAAAYMVGQTGQAMTDAANNTNGAAAAFMGMSMAQNAGGINVGNLYAMGQAEGQTSDDRWFCGECGSENHGGKFCTNCGKPRK